ncbi:MULTISPECIES: hypothetical protein [unclassified Chryseobacterium]|uniref:hypothetical protein n=1 Tax=unclassified Chryseobacterium TaxID=2593645 RepID=UPI00285363CF|nr:hypothetical protein [Chryseobacterium sp. CFS7]MDR4892252.1 hypothetical protein [Chryseobacterium sp. CFS7]
MNKDELLKIYSAYLQFDVTVRTALNTDFILKGISFRGSLQDKFGIDFTNIQRGRLHLWDLSYLTKEIEHDGERFVPIRKIYELNGWEWDDEEVNEIDEIGICSDLNLLTYATAQILLSWHFNIFSLPESEYINKATLTTNK